MPTLLSSISRSFRRKRTFAAPARSHPLPIMPLARTPTTVATTQDGLTASAVRTTTTSSIIIIITITIITIISRNLPLFYSNSHPTGTSTSTSTAASPEMRTPTVLRKRSLTARALTMQRRATPAKRTGNRTTSPWQQEATPPPAAGACAYPSLAEPSTMPEESTRSRLRRHHHHCCRAHRHRASTEEAPGPAAQGALWAMAATAGTGEPPPQRCPALSSQDRSVEPRRRQGR